MIYSIFYIKYRVNIIIYNSLHMWIASEAVDSWHTASQNLDIKTKKLVAEDRKARITWFLDEIRRPNSIEVYNDIKESIHYEIFSLKDSELTRVLDILGDEETDELIENLNEAQISRISRLWSLEQLLVSPTKTEVSDIIESKQLKVSKINTNNRVSTQKTNSEKIYPEKETYNPGLFERAVDYFDLDREVFKTVLWIKDTVKSVAKNT